MFIQWNPVNQPPCVTVQRSQCTLLDRLALDKSPGSGGSVRNMVQRSRKDAPPLPPFRKRGSEQVACEIARSPHLVGEALSDHRRRTRQVHWQQKPPGNPCGTNCLPYWTISPIRSHQRERRAASRKVVR